MCSIEDAEPFLVHSVKTHKAHKTHRCGECGRVIQTGERYVREFGVEGTSSEKFAFTHCVCAHCEVAREWVSQECGGCVWGMVHEDLYGHIRGIGADGKDCLQWEPARLYVGLRRQWRSFTRQGELGPIPHLYERTTIKKSPPGVAD